MEKFSASLKEIRLENGLTQKQLSQLLKVSHTTVSSWEKSTREPSLEMLEKIAIALKCDVNYLIGFGE